MPNHAVAPLGGPLTFSERLQAVTEALAAVHTQEGVFGLILTPALAALNALAGAVLLVDEPGWQLKMAAAQGEEGAQGVWQDGPLDSSGAVGDALGRHEALFFEHHGALARAYPELEARTGGVAAVATAALPMFLDARPLDALILDFREPHEFTEAEIHFLRTLAAQCAVALGRAHRRPSGRSRVSRASSTGATAPCWTTGAESTCARSWRAAST
ncbi:GAF domain-containing protein [Deinococcus sp. QL22]|uniref:GAF domain-containing protein n=1 Tax=Deinococcus sp. QL22 TaxID=2939437 RepID=UPI00201819C5|nr:GAF domain-containing protein [Deinococcus sp. QL22]UQN09059.1 GAF domain-containing protein [Deinococcus sp. QL22]